MELIAPLGFIMFSFLYNLFDAHYIDALIVFFIELPHD